MNEEIKIIKITGTAVPVKGNDIDTDRIIPARYLRCVSFSGLEKYLFYDERFDEMASKKDHPLNDPKYGDASILLVNKNFGCGSSREHAPQSIMRHGIKVIIGESFSEIFRGNCNVMGMPTVTVSSEDINYLMNEVEINPQVKISINLENTKISIKDREITFEINESARSSFLSGTWDSTEILLENINLVKEKRENLPYLARI